MADGNGERVKRPRLSAPEDFADLNDLDEGADLGGDSSDDSSYHPEKGELQEFQREIDAKTTKLVKAVRDWDSSNPLDIDLAAILKDRIVNTLPIDHDFLVTELRFTMANAIQFKKWSALEVLIENSPPDLVKQVFTGGFPLINFAIRINSVDGVKILLKHGAHDWPDFSVSSFDTIISAMEDAFDYEYFTEGASKAFLKIFKLLCQHGAEPSKCPRLAFQIVSIAGRSPEIASFLMSNVQWSGLFETENQRCRTPLFHALEAMNWWDSITVLENMFRYGVLELLRMGAALCPWDDFFLMNLSPAHNLVALDKRLSMKIWKQSHVILRIVIEARRKSSLDVATILKEMPTPKEQSNDEEDESNSSHSSGQNFEDSREVVSFTLSQFPRNLQTIARTSVLNALPTGPQRPEAVGKLDLPSQLISFLNFQEFDLPTVSS